eukprot:c11930_g1_i1.p1 GENE.c11930_g1_i1~~c11930_g1_i1.p1  ORF type:complete len:1217 (+),score=270.71 c11930_g1_i1:145-3795(+)
MDTPTEVMQMAVRGKARYFGSKYNMYGDSVVVEVRSGYVRIVRPDEPDVTDIFLSPINSSIDLQKKTTKFSEIVVKVKTGVQKTKRRNNRSIQNVHDLRSLSGKLKTITIRVAQEDTEKWMRSLKSCQNEDAKEITTKNKALQRQIAEMKTLLEKKVTSNLEEDPLHLKSKVHELRPSQSPTAWTCLQRFGVTDPVVGVKRVAVLGSINMDLMATVDRLTEDLINKNSKGDFVMSAGGKGSNEAVAVARLGIDTSMIACVGRDEFGEIMKKRMVEDGINCRFVRYGDEATSTGVAVIVKGKLDRGKVTISCTGANSLVSPDDAKNLDSLFTKSDDSTPPVDILILQLEVPLPTVELAAAQAKSRGKTVVLKSSPIPDHSLEHLLASVDVLFSNEFEGVRVARKKVLGDMPAASGLGDAFTLAMTIMSENPNLQIAVVSSFSSHACLVRQENGFQRILVPMMLAEVIDVIGAADCTVGGFVAAHAFGIPPSQAMVWAQSAAALSTMGEGAQESCPTLDNMMRFQTIFAPGLPEWFDSVSWVAADVQAAVVAILLGNAQALKEALSHIGNVNEPRDFQGQTLLHISALSGRAQMASILLQQGADPLATDKYGFTVLHRATTCVLLTKPPGNKQVMEDVVNLLLVSCIARKIPFSAVSGTYHFTGRGPFMADKGKFVESEAELIESAKQYKLTAFKPYTNWVAFSAKSRVFATVHWPEEEGGDVEGPASVEVLRSGLVHGNLEIREYLEYLILSGDIVVPQVVLSYKVPPLAHKQVQPSEPHTIEHAAAFSGRIQLLRWLRQHGGVPSSNQNGQRNALHFAAMGGDVNVCKLLMHEWEFDISVLDHEKKNPLQYVHIEETRKKLEQEANITDVFVTYKADAAQDNHNFADALAQKLIAKDISVRIEEESGDPKHKDQSAKLCKVLLVLVGDPDPQPDERHIARLRTAIIDYAKPRRLVIPPHIPAKNNIMRMLPGLGFGSEFDQQFINFREKKDLAFEEEVEHVASQVRLEVSRALQLAKEKVVALQPGALPKSSFPISDWEGSSKAPYIMVCSADPEDMNLDQDPTHCFTSNTGGIGHRIFGHLTHRGLQVMLGTRTHDNEKLKQFINPDECKVIVIVFTSASGDDGQKWVDWQVQQASGKKVVVVPWADTISITQEVATGLNNLAVKTMGLVDWQGKVTAVASTDNFQQVAKDLWKEILAMGVTPNVTSSTTATPSK